MDFKVKILVVASANSVDFWLIVPCSSATDVTVFCLITTCFELLFDLQLKGACGQSRDQRWNSGAFPREGASVFWESGGGLEPWEGGHHVAQSQWFCFFPFSQGSLFFCLLFFAHRLAVFGLLIVLVLDLYCSWTPSSSTCWCWFKV